MANVMKISEAASLALHTMVLLAAEQEGTERPVTAKEVAETLDVSEAHLLKVVQRLAHAGLVRGDRGPGGGFTLARRSDAVTLMDVYEAVEGPLTKTTCLLTSRLCGGDHCILGDLLERMNSEFRRYLSQTRLIDLAETSQKLARKGAHHA